MDGFIEYLFAWIINLYILFLFVRIFALERERYDPVLGMVFTLTDPPVNFLRAYWPPGQAHLLPIPAILVLLFLKGLLFGSVAAALQGFLDTLFQLYVLIIIVISMLHEYYVNPIANFVQRLVRPVRAVATNVSRHPVVVTLLSIGLLVLLHTVLTLAISTFLPAPSLGRPMQGGSFVYSLRLIVHLSGFFTLVIIVSALMSWISPDPFNPIVQLLTLISAPIVDPIRRLIPPLGGVLDISPILAILALQFVSGLAYNLLGQL